MWNDGFLIAILQEIEEGMGFKINQYDICVANKMINGKQFTVLWHVDDLKISLKDKKVVTDFY